MRPDPDPQQGDVGWLMDRLCDPCSEGEHDLLDGLADDCVCCGRPASW